jgi:hypothetical protein
MKETTTISISSFSISDKSFLKAGLSQIKAKYIATEQGHALLIIQSRILPLLF